MRPRCRWWGFPRGLLKGVSGAFAVEDGGAVCRVLAARTPSAGVRPMQRQATVMSKKELTGAGQGFL